jgi:hypothetical protein
MLACQSSSAGGGRTGVAAPRGGARRRSWDGHTRILDGLDYLHEVLYLHLSDRAAALDEPARLDDSAARVADEKALVARLDEGSVVRASMSLGFTALNPRDLENRFTVPRSGLAITSIMNP